MQKVDAVDLEFLYLAASRPRGFNETDIAKSDLNYLGVGRTLDRLASLKEREMIRTDADGFFAITQKGKSPFWDSGISLQARILWLLQIKSFSPEDVARYLLESDVNPQIDELRKNGMVLLTTIRKESQVDRVCEITQEGVEFLEKQRANPNHRIQQVLDEISKKSQHMSEQKMDETIEKLRSISDDL